MAPNLPSKLHSSGPTLHFHLTPKAQGWSSILADSVKTRLSGWWGRDKITPAHTTHLWSWYSDSHKGQYSSALHVWAGYSLPSFDCRPLFTIIYTSVSKGVPTKHLHLFSSFSENSNQWQIAIPTRQQWAGRHYPSSPCPPSTDHGFLPTRTSKIMAISWRSKVQHFP